jgi:hypothetical protein
MNRRTFFAGSLVGFLLVWRMLGFTATTLDGKAMARSTRYTSPEVQSLAAVAEFQNNPRTLVTGNQPMQIGGWQIYGVLGLGALLLLLAFLWAAKRADRIIRRKRPRGKP